ncbi:MAG: hypothetical protein LUE86_04770 [Clostridiales bacterium]|nr:hypothetical protein [Clostridiales bacterium]
MAFKSIAFYDRGSWYHRYKVLQGDGTTKYARKGGFATEEDAERSYYECDQIYRKACRAHNASRSSNFSLEDYLIYWLDEVYSARAESTSKALAT